MQGQPRQHSEIVLPEKNLKQQQNPNHRLIMGNICFGNCNKARKEIKVRQIGQEKTKLPLFTDELICKQS